jgi:uncharacterized small protein (DUF1192 family)
MAGEEPAEGKRLSIRGRQRGRRGGLLRSENGHSSIAGDLAVDPYRSIVFPNRIREQRIRSGHPRLFAFAAQVKTIPYIRLSKLERGEVFARVDELQLLGRILEVPPADLLLDTEAAEFDIAEWFLPFADGTAADTHEEAEFALLLAAAIRARRDADPTLTAATMNELFGIPPVILSRLENAQKGLNRWNEATVASLCRLFDMASERAMRDYVHERYAAGDLDATLGTIAGSEQRIARTRQRIAVLKAELTRGGHSPSAALPHPTEGQRHTIRMIDVYGTPLASGLLEMSETGSQIEAPSVAGPRAFGLRVARSPVGPGLPGHATLIVDPDRYPQAGGLAVVRTEEGHRVVAVASDKHGQLLAYSITPSFEQSVDELPSVDVAAVVAAIFI